MKSSFIPLLAAASLSLLFSIPTSAQVKKGFKHYRKKRYEKAEVKFNKALARRPQEAPVAQLGLFLMRQGEVFHPGSSYREIEEAFLEIKSAKAGFDSLPAKKKAWLKRKKHLQITGSNYDIILARAQRQAIERIRAADSLLLLDTFSFYMAPLHERLQDDYAELEDSLTMHNYYSRHYETLRSIARNHAHVLEAHQRRLPPSFYSRLILVFLHEYPLSDYRRLVNDFPGLWATDDCYIEEYLAAVESRKLEYLASFMSTCHQSNTDEITVKALLMPPNQYLRDQKSKLKGEDLRCMEGVLQTADWITNGFRLLAPAEVVAQVKAELELAAPANRTYILLVEALRHLRALGEWERSLELVEYASPFFRHEGELDCLLPSYILHNKEAVWFDKMVRRLQQEAENKPIFPLAEPVNSPEGNEFGPVVSIDGLQLWWGAAGRKANIKKEDVFLSSLQDSAWTAPAIERNLSGQRAEKPLSITANEDVILLSIEGTLHLSRRSSPEGMWGRPRPVSSAVNDFPWVGAGTLSRDGKVLIYEASDDPKPFLNEENIDLYIAFYSEESESWSLPQQLGPEVNTPQFQEMSPHIHADNRTLLFSTAGHFGFAGVDAFMVTRQDDSWLNWSAPRNLGKEVNSYENDWRHKFSLPASGKKAYLSTQKSLSEQPADLIEASLPAYARPPRVLVIKGKVNSHTGATRIRAKPVYPTEGEPIDSCKVLEGGHFRLLLPGEGEDKAFIYADDSTVYSTIVEVGLEDVADVSTLDPSPLTIRLSTLASKEIPIPLEKVRFEKGSTALSPEFRKELDWVAHYFAGRRQTLLIGGHTDEEGTNAEQEALSLARAEAVKAYLAGQGINGGRIWTQGFADEQPLEKGSGEKNRRVEIYLKKP